MLVIQAHAFEQYKPVESREERSGAQTQGIEVAEGQNATPGMKLQIQFTDVVLMKRAG